MGRLIDTSELAKHIALQKKRFGNLLEVPICNVFTDMIRDTPTAEAIPKAEYENHLKTILVELQSEIEECVDGAEGSPQFEQGVTTARVQVVELIQEKINALRGGKNDK